MNQYLLTLLSFFPSRLSVVPVQLHAFSLNLFLFILDPGKLSSCNLCRRIGSERSVGKTVFLFAVLVPEKQLKRKLFQR